MRQQIEDFQFEQSGSFVKYDGSLLPWWLWDLIASKKAIKSSFLS
jgi:hypothetical protein